MAAGDIILSNGTTITAAEVAEIAGEVKKLIAKEAKEPSQYEEVGSLAGLTTLPALLQNGSVYKLVRVAVELLKGMDGKEVSLRKTDTALQWQLGDGEWQDLLLLADIKGEKGDPFTYADFTTEQIEELKRPATEAAETANQAAEAANQAEALRSAAETAREEAESTRQAAEVAREQAESGRGEAEDLRQTNEDARIAAELTRKANEEARQEAETARQTAEDNRAVAEEARAEAEDKRIEAENLRAESEITRQQSEIARAADESNREANETERQAQELRRQSDTSTAISNAETATAAANEAAAKATDAAIAANTAAENITRKEVPTLESAPTEATVSYVNSKGDTIRFYIGDECRVMENGEYTFYKLYDLVDGVASWGVASWGEAGGGLSLTRNLYLQSANYYNESVQIVREGDTL